MPTPPAAPTPSQPDPLWTVLQGAGAAAGVALGLFNLWQNRNRPKIEATLDYVKIVRGEVTYGVSMVNSGNRMVTIREILKTYTDGVEHSAYRIGETEKVITVQPNEGAVFQFTEDASEPQPQRVDVIAHYKPWYRRRFIRVRAKFDQQAMNTRLSKNLLVQMFRKHVSGWNFDEGQGQLIIATRPKDNSRVELKVARVYDKNDQSTQIVDVDSRHTGELVEELLRRLTFLDMSDSSKWVTIPIFDTKRSRKGQPTNLFYSDAAMPWVRNALGLYRGLAGRYDPLDLNTGEDRWQNDLPSRWTSLDDEI